MPKDSKKAKAKGGKSTSKKPTNKQEEGAVLAELELRDEQLDKVSGGTTPSIKTEKKDITTVINNTLDALNLGLY